jgi:uncharacterized protein DUF3892
LINNLYLIDRQVYKLATPTSGMEYQIVYVVKNQEGIIIHVGLNDGHNYPIDTIIRLIGEHHTFFTYENVVGRRDSVYALQNASTGRWFLTTSPDTANENN